MRGGREVRRETERPPSSNRAGILETLLAILSLSKSEKRREIGERMREEEVKEAFRRSGSACRRKPRNCRSKMEGKSNISGAWEEEKSGRISKGKGNGEEKEGTLRQ